MDTNNLNNIGMPKSGVELMRERLFGGPLEGVQRDTRVNYELPESATVEREDNFTERMLRPARDLVDKKAEKRWRVKGLRSLVLYDKADAYKADVMKHAELAHLVPDRVRADKSGFNMLLGGELSRTVGNGDTYGALKATIAAMPVEEQLAAKGRMQKCETEYKAKELLGELWGGLITKDYETQKAEQEKKLADMQAARKELMGVLDSDWLQAVMEGHEDIPWQVRNVANMERAGLKAEDIAGFRETHGRAKGAFAKLMDWMYGDSYAQVKVDARIKGEALKREWEESVHFAWEDKPSDAQFMQQGAAELSKSFDLSREQLAELIMTLSDESGQLDENAVALFFGAIDKEVKDGQTIISSKFWRNFGEALSDFSRETIDFADRVMTRNRSHGLYMDASGQPAYLSELPGGVEMIEDAKVRMKTAYGADAEKFKGYLTRFDKLRVQAAEGASLWTDVLTEGGTVTGASVPMLVMNTAIPGLGGVVAGAATMYPSLTNEAIARNYAEGVTDAETVANIEGAWQAAAEGMFGAVLGKVPGMSKVGDWAARKTAGVPVVGKAVAKLRSELNEKRGGVRKLLGEWFVERGGGAAVMISANDALVDAVAASLWGPYVDYAVEDELDLQPLWHGGMALQDVLAYDELYAAYPELTQLRVETVKMEGGTRGRVVSSAGQHIIQINKNLEGEWTQFFSTLMHEVQHVIQDIEGFAKGGNPQSARDAAGNYKRRYEIQNESARLRQNIAWLEGYDVARREFLNIGDAISMREDKEKLQDLRDKYNNLAYQYNKGAIAEPGFNGEDGRDSSFVIPSLSGVTKGAYAKAQKAWDITQDRKAAFPGMLERLRARYDVLWAEFSELDKQQQRWGTLSSHELYLRLAGEIEARNVQQRVRMTAAERLGMPFNETLEYPGEALVTFSVASVTAEWQNTLDGYLQARPQPGTPEHTRDLVVCPTPAVMQMVGAKGWDMVVTPGVLDKVMRGKHAVSVVALRQLPAALAAPVCIAVSDTPGCLEVITELKEGQHNVLVAVQLDSRSAEKKEVKVNRIASMYGKERIASLLNHPMLYWDKAKARVWMQAYRLQLPAQVLPKRASGRRIQTPADLVKYKMQSGLSFSLSGRDMLYPDKLGNVRGEEKMQRMMNYARKEAARWERTFGKDTPNARAAEAMGTISSIMGAIHKELPPKFRPRLDGHMRYVEVYARLLESGKVRTYGKLNKAERAAVEAELMEALREEQQRADAAYELAKKDALDAAELTGAMAALEEAATMDVDNEVKRAAYLDRLAKRTANETRRRLLAEAEAKKKLMDAEVEALKRDFAAEKLAKIAGRMLNEAADAVEQYLIDEVMQTVPMLLERLTPRKLPNGKYDKGRMSADAYRKLVKYVQMIETNGEEVAKQMEKLGTLIAAEEAKSDDEAPDGEVLDALQAELAEWSTYGNLREKCLDAVRKGVAALREFAVYEKNAWSGFLQLHRNRAKRIALRAADALGGADEFKVKEESEKSAKLKQRLADLGAGLQSIGQMFYGLAGVPELRGLVDESLDALSAGHVALTLREKRAYEQLAEFMKSMGLDTENKRNNWMAALKKKHNTGIMREGILVRHRLKLTPEEAEMWLSMTKGEREVKRAELEADADKKEVLVENVPYEEDIPLLREALAEFRAEPEGKKWVHTYREFRKDAPKEPMVLSKDEAMNILLLCEQGDYLDAAHDNGYTDEVLEQLGAFVGAEVMSFGYAMRGILEGNGLAEVYEAREGVPFPAVKNYWPGNFDQSARVNEQANALDPTSGNGTRYGMLITRVKHKLRFNILGATNVFMAALAQQNNYIVMGELTAKWRRLLSHNDFAMSLKQYMGVAQFKQFKELIELLDGAGVQESITQQTLSGVLGQFQSAHAMAVLAGSPITLVKQVSAMINAGAWEGISMGRVLARIVLDRFDKGAIRYRDMLKKDYFRARCKDNRYFTEMMQLGRDANWSKLSKWARTGMGWIEKMDVLTNCAGMTALYNITYHDLKYRNEGAADPMTEEEMHAECDRVVRNALELGAQPLRRTQKSAFAALSRNALVKATCYMGSEAINKVGVALSLSKRTGGGIKGFLKAWKYLAGISFAQQIIVMALDMARNADPVDDDEWAEWALLNLATGASGAGIVQSIPVLGEAVQKLTGGYVKTGSLGQMVYDFEGAWRSGKKVAEMATDDKDDAWAEWAWAGGNLGRHLTFATGAWGGITSTSKVLSEMSGLFQSLNAMSNMVRPVIQAERNEATQEKRFRKKVEKSFLEARKKTRAEEKVKREAEKKARKAEKKRDEMLKRL